MLCDAKPLIFNKKKVLFFSLKKRDNTCVGEVADI